jgi:hypothetical protein
MRLYREHKRTYYEFNLFPGVEINWQKIVRISFKKDIIFDNHCKEEWIW